MRPSLAVLALSVFVGASPAPALTPRLVKDINPAARGADSNPQAFVALPNGVSLFVASDGDGYVLWRSDGTPAGTHQVVDLRPGALGSDPTELTALGDRVFFIADDGDLRRIVGTALWSSDGTAAGTRLIGYGPRRTSFFRPHELQRVGSRLFFFATTPNRGLELWRTDGTDEGTRAVTDVAPGPQGFRGILNNHSVVHAGRLWFVADTGAAPGERGQRLLSPEPAGGGQRPLLPGRQH